MKGFALGLILKQRRKATQKWATTSLHSVIIIFCVHCDSPVRAKLHITNICSVQRAALCTSEEIWGPERAQAETGY